MGGEALVRDLLCSILARRPRQWTRIRACPPMEMSFLWAYDELSCVELIRKLLGVGVAGCFSVDDMMPLPCICRACDGGVPSSRRLIILIHLNCFHAFDYDDNNVLTTTILRFAQAST